uniref:Ig-like domain-containing protein n=1 Tax=Oryzias latipes TaxID=8090 RepID=A0A3P9LI20_ORYLA
MVLYCGEVSFSLDIRRTFSADLHLTDMLLSLLLNAVKSFFLFSLFPGEPIIAAPGDDVILPCHLDSQEDLQDHSVEWFKLDMKPDPQGRIPFVFLYWNGQIITKHMSESFIPRVSLDQDGLKRGDVTLKIRNVSLQDEGKYSCFIPGKNFRETVQLVVGEFALQVLPHMKNICPEQQHSFSSKQHKFSFYQEVLFWFQLTM